MATATHGQTNPDVPAAALKTFDPPAAHEGLGDANSAERPHPSIVPTPEKPGADLSPKDNRAGLTITRRSPVPLTGVAAMAEVKKRKQQAAASRETSPNPAAQAVQSLMGTTSMSKPSDAPATSKLSEPLQRVVEKIHVPENISGEATQVSPVSMGSFGTAESFGGGSAALTATASDGSASSQPQFVAEPAQMSETTNHENGTRGLGVAAGDDGHKAFSYPGPPPHQNSEAGPSRGASLPGYGQNSPKSPATNKRHKCPYCATDFTRHHNLKSHLLTHSQEKPYVCGTCPARFRRLHDLKRHTKLHTGEKPHICDKCGRRFARGDALARHNKGPGGCAGRRSSFGGDDDYDGDGNGPDGMDGIEYNGADDEGSSPEQGRRESEPSRKRPHVESPYDPNRQVYRQESSTYPPPVYPPPPQSRTHAGDMGPPQVVLPGSGQVASPREINNYPSPAAGTSINSSYYNQPNAVFPQPGGMTESPRPISPGHPPDQQRLSVGDASMSSALHRNRSPSLTTQFQHAHLVRGSGGRTPPTQHHAAQPAPVLPPIGSGQGTGRGTLPSSSSLVGGSGSSAQHNQQVGPVGSNPSSLSSHGQQSSVGSMREAMGQDQSDIWNYVRSLETRFSRMQDEYELRISRLQEELITLRGQISNPGTYSSEIPQPRY